MKQIILFLSLIFAVQTVTAQETWNACNSTVNVIPAPSYDSTFVLEAPSRAALQKGMANWVPASSGGAASYLVYTALLTQSGTSAPVATVLENTLGGTVVWSRDASGIYVATLSGAFTANKTTPISQREQQSSDNVDDTPKWLTGLRLTDNTYGLNTGNYDIGLSDSVLNGAFIEIRVYP